MKVVTWCTPGTYGFDRINICQECADKLEDQSKWPRNWRGDFYCDVLHGLHDGSCDICQLPDDDEPWWHLSEGYFF